MEALRQIIYSNQKKWPDFEYYLPIIEKAENDLHNHPDISIEKSKALIEGICASVLKYLDNTYSDQWLKNASLGQVFSRAKDVIVGIDRDYDERFLKHATQLVHQLGVITTEIGRIRTHKGDISHGKAAPKTSVSSPHFAQMVFCVAEGICQYFLHVLCSTDPAAKKELEYDENPEFNALVDADYELLLEDHGLQLPFPTYRHSEVMFSLRREEYLIQLDEYLYEKSE